MGVTSPVEIRAGPMLCCLSVGPRRLLPLADQLADDDAIPGARPGDRLLVCLRGAAVPVCSAARFQLLFLGGT